MGSPSLTQRLLHAAKKGQEIVTDGPDGQLVPVEHRPRVETDSILWVVDGGGLKGRRRRAAECHARLPLDVPAGTMVEHTLDRRRGVLMGPAPELSDRFVRVEFATGNYALDVSRSLLRRAS